MARHHPDTRSRYRADRVGALFLLVVGFLNLAMPLFPGVKVSIRTRNLSPAPGRDRDRRAGGPRSPYVASSPLGLRRVGSRLRRPAALRI